MKLQPFLETYPEVLFDSRNDDIFTFFRLSMYGMCSARLAKLLNHACKHLGETECYLEIGTYAGFTLLSAGYESSRHFIGIDNFSANWSGLENVKDKLLENVARHPGNYHLIDNDFRKVNFLGSIPNNHSVGVCLIDGEHIYTDVVDSVKAVRDVLSPEALLIFDDLNVPEVRKAVDTIKEDPAFEEIFFANSFVDQTIDRGMRASDYIHNGFSLVSYHAIA